MTKQKTTAKNEIKDEVVKLKGKYIYAVGRRKTATAVIKLFKKGEGTLIANGKKLEEYFDATNAAAVKQPLKLVGNQKDINLLIKVSGGGKTGQAEATRYGICKALLEVDENLRPSFKSKGWLTRDARKKERKKPGLRKARRAPQWAKR